ncbi:hypothetical protein [Parasphingopyxis sp.]|uniref:hypothetical protein n=1 Tax=Parasphingopyxis sp. TaxID=1920299 RepID=UPI0026368C17|nr:hypothetical protein [Parasphingopyxis sp.]
MPTSLISAGISAIGSIGGSLLGGSSTKKAAQTASDTSLAVNQQNNALAQNIYNQNVNRSNPFVQSGIGATNRLNSILGLGSVSSGNNAAPSFPSYGGGGSPSFGGTFPIIPGYTPPTSGNAFSGIRREGMMPGLVHPNSGGEPIMLPGFGPPASIAPGGSPPFTNVPGGLVPGFGNQPQSNQTYTPTAQTTSQPAPQGDPFANFLSAGNLDAGGPAAQSLSSDVEYTPASRGSNFSTRVRYTPASQGRLFSTRVRFQPASQGEEIENADRFVSTLAGPSYSSLSRNQDPRTGRAQTSLSQFRPTRVGGELTSGMIGTALDPGSFDDYRESTGYDYRLGQGVEALQQAAAFGGSLNSGDTMRSLIRFGQDIGSAERQNYRGELDNYIRYNDAFAQNERGYRDDRSDLHEARLTDNRRYTDTFRRGERSYLDNRSDLNQALDRDNQRYVDAYRRGERGYRDDRRDLNVDRLTDNRRYANSFAEAQRGYVDARSDADFARRFAVGQYGDQFAEAKRAYVDSRSDADFERRFALGQYGDQFAQNRREYADSRSDADFARRFAVGQYGDNFARSERAYQDSRGDYDRALRNDLFQLYLQQLSQQQGVGLSASNALAGVGTNYVGQVSSNNRAAADIAAQAAIARGAANNNTYSSIGNALGSFIGGINF